MAVDSDTRPLLQSAKDDDAQLENARVGYQAAVSLMAFEGNLLLLLAVFRP
ncbi:hypothetical protein ACN27F_06565 [Solwaraspora sp. WMMB335]|uniref:hypothetical protein n=1 Tax=Solwaraspora sp. WMMB335 TaxID=3404118 RepID=UPI003B953578